MIYLSIGSNLSSSFGDRIYNIKKTVHLLRNNEIFIKKISSFYETPSYPNEKNPRFINIALSIFFKGKPNDLLSKIIHIENIMGRIRKIKNEPRICDIDIIDFNGLILNQKNLILPHYLLSKRNFVLFPLQEISPEWVHPISKRKIDKLIKSLDFKSSNEITRLNESVILI